MTAGIAARHTRLSGVNYAPGQPVLPEVVNRRTIALGLVHAVPDAAVAGIRVGTEATVEAFDPGEHTAAEVATYLDEHPDQLDRVANAEKAGKARKGVLADIEARREAVAAAAPGKGNDLSGEDGGGGDSADPVAVTTPPDAAGGADGGEDSDDKD